MHALTFCPVAHTVHNSSTGAIPALHSGATTAIICQCTVTGHCARFTVLSWALCTSKLSWGGHFVYVCAVASRARVCIGALALCPGAHTINGDWLGTHKQIGRT